MKILVSLCTSVDSIQKENGKLVYKGMTFIDFDKPIEIKDKRYKRAVLARKGNNFKLIKYGHVDYEDFTTHKDPERRENFRKRFRGILKSNGKPAYKDKWQAAYWAYNDLW
jgi:predicted N-acyltransferase